MAARRRDLLGGLGLTMAASLAPRWAPGALAANASRQPSDDKTLSVGALFPGERSAGDLGE